MTLIPATRPARAHDDFHSGKSSWPAGPPEVGRRVAAAAAAAAAVSRAVLAVPPRPKQGAVPPSKLVTLSLVLPSCLSNTCELTLLRAATVLILLG